MFLELQFSDVDVVVLIAPAVLAHLRGTFRCGPQVLGVVVVNQAEVGVVMLRESPHQAAFPSRYAGSSSSHVASIAPFG